MDLRSPPSGSPSFRSNPTETGFTSQSSNNGRRGQSSNLTAILTGSQIDSTDRYRMGIPGELRPAPLQRHAVNAGNPIIPLWEDVFRPAIQIKLNEYKIRWQNMSLYRRTFRNRTPTDADLTIYIVAHQEDNDQWVLFLDSVSKFLTSNGYQNLLVEIVDPRATNGLLTFPIRHDDPILRDWESIRPILRQELQMDLKWTALHAYRRGYDTSGNDSVPTVVVFCQDYFADHWKEVSLRIRGILSRLHYEVRLEISQAKMRRGAFELPSAALPASAFEMTVSMGDSIGPRDGTGTLGGYVNLIDNQKRAKTFGLTNYHVVRTADMAAAAHDNCGAHTVEDTGCAIDIFSPSLNDINSSIQANLQYIEMLEMSLETARAKAEMGDEAAKNRVLQGELKINKAVDDRSLMENFRSHFGNVHSFSGFRKASNDFALDWALIDVDVGRHAGNSLPLSSANNVLEAFKDGNWANPMEEFTRTSTAAFETSLPDRERQVFKRGRTTMESWGVLNRIKPDVRVTDDGIDRVYRAWEVVPASDQKDFSHDGDSGAFVLDCENRVCGLLFATGQPEIGGPDRAIGYLTPIDAVFEDIRTITGCDVLLPE